MDSLFRNRLRNSSSRTLILKGCEGDHRRYLQGRYCFLCFFRPPIERRDSHWSDLKNYSNSRSDWLATVIQEDRDLLTLAFNNQASIELFLEETLRSLEDTDIKFVLIAEQKRAIKLFESMIFWPFYLQAMERVSFLLTAFKK